MTIDYYLKVSFVTFYRYCLTKWGEQASSSRACLEFPDREITPAPTVDLTHDFPIGKDLRYDGHS
ncbi:MAG: hypothetical protein ACK5SV_04815, partial [Burkholderiales bacterium]